MKWLKTPGSCGDIPGSRTGSALSSALFKAVDAAFPRHCPVCGEIASPPGYLVCRTCFPKLSFVRPPVCMKCGRAIQDDTEEFCGECQKRSRSFSYGLALLNYDDIMRRAVGQIKYYNRREYIKPFGKMFWMRLSREIRDMKAECLVPVPVHPARRRERGFNQAELLAREISGYAGLPVRTDLLFRRKQTQAQKELSPDERIRNLEQAFEADPARMDVKSLILVDDIYTTGSTAEACTRVLRAAGAEQVYVLCLCIVPEA